ncbi:hypothetical protein [Spirosoma arcticum]
MDSKTQEKDKAESGIARYVGVIGSVVTIMLTLYNTFVIETQQNNLKELEIKLQERATGLDESRERVDRYKWVLSLFPALDDTDERKRNFTTSLMRLALTKDEAQQLFTGFQTSTDKTLQSVGQSGIIALQNEPIALLIANMNASSADIRKKTVANLITTYQSSSQAISLTLQLYEPERINALSPSGLINGLVFLKNTDPKAWKLQQIQQGRDVVARVKEKATGPQTRQVAAELLTFLTSIKQESL